MSVRTLLILGADSPDFVHDAVGLVDSALPNSRVVVLDGQQHVADQLIPEEFARILLGFLDPDGAGAERWSRDCQRTTWSSGQERRGWRSPTPLSSTPTCRR